jgi:hypothetical protein
LASGSNVKGKDATPNPEDPEPNTLVTWGLNPHLIRLFPSVCESADLTNEFLEITATYTDCAGPETHPGRGKQ